MEQRDYKIQKSDKIFVAGHRGLVGSAIVRSLERQGYKNIVKRTHKELDLMNQAAVYKFFEEEKPDVVVLAAAKVGGINANKLAPASFAYENMQIQCNVINASYGSSAYPRGCTFDRTFGTDKRRICNCKDFRP